jgi:hypothetical protein
MVKYFDIHVNHEYIYVMNREEKNRKQREYRQRTKNSCTTKYEKTPNGYLMRKYRNMKSRVNGIQKLKHHLYLGKELLSKEEFYEWANSSTEFISLFNNYVNSGYDMKLAPTVDRIDSQRGYTIDNMRWLTHSENSRNGANSRFSKQNNL